MSFEFLLSEEEVKANESRKGELLNLFQTGEGVLLAGSGCSTPVYPKWKELIIELERHALSINPKFKKAEHSGKLNYLEYADAIKDAIGPESYYAKLDDIFSPTGKDYKKLHEIVCHLYTSGNIRAVTTTNYDVLFEMAFNSIAGGYFQSVYIDSGGLDHRKVFQFIHSLNRGNEHRFIYHLHGLFNMKGSIILSKSEYEEKYGSRIVSLASDLFDDIEGKRLSKVKFSELINQSDLMWKLHRKILWMLLATRRMIFIGFSFDDQYFLEMLSGVKDELHPIGISNHFLIARVSNESEKKEALQRSREWLQSYGITVVMYEDDEKGDGLELFFQDMWSKLSVESVAKVQSQKVTGGAAASVSDEGDATLTERLIMKNKGK